MSRKDLWVKDIQEKIEEKQEGKKPSKKVKEWDKSKVTSSVRDILAYVPPKGLFTQSAEVIAAQLKKDSKDLKQAMSRLNFYINRAGENIDSSRLNVLDKAKEKLRTLFKTKKSNFHIDANAFPVVNCDKLNIGEIDGEAVKDLEKELEHKLEDILEEGDCKAYLEGFKWTFEVHEYAKTSIELALSSPAQDVTLHVEGKLPSGKKFKFKKDYSLSKNSAKFPKAKKINLNEDFGCIEIEWFNGKELEVNVG